MDDYERVRTALAWIDRAAQWVQRLAIFWVISIVVGTFTHWATPYDYLGTFASYCLSGGIGVALLQRWDRQDDERKARSNA